MCNVSEGLAHCAVPSGLLGFVGQDVGLSYAVTVAQHGSVRCLLVASIITARLGSAGCLWVKLLAAAYESGATLLAAVGALSRMVAICYQQTSQVGMCWPHILAQHSRGCMQSDLIPVLFDKDQVFSVSVCHKAGAR